MADGGGIGGCKLATRLLEQIMTGLWSFVSLNQVFAASIDLAHDDAAMCWWVYSGEDRSNARRSPGTTVKVPRKPLLIGHTQPAAQKQWGQVFQ